MWGSKDPNVNHILGRVCRARGNFQQPTRGERWDGSRRAALGAVSTPAAAQCAERVSEQGSGAKPTGRLATRPGS